MTFSLEDGLVELAHDLVVMRLDVFHLQQTVLYHELEGIGHHWIDDHYCHQLQPMVDLESGHSTNYGPSKAAARRSKVSVEYWAKMHKTLASFSRAYQQANDAPEYALEEPSAVTDEIFSLAVFLSQHEVVAVDQGS